MVIVKQFFYPVKNILAINNILQTKEKKRRSSRKIRNNFDICFVMRRFKVASCVNKV